MNSQDYCWTASETGNISKHAAWAGLRIGRIQNAPSKAACLTKSARRVTVGWAGNPAPHAPVDHIEPAWSAAFTNVFRAD